MNETIFGYYSRMIYHIIPAIILGIIIDKYLTKLQTIYLPNNHLFYVILQLIIIILALYVIQKYISPTYASSWQSTTPGILFVSLFFGIQVNLYKNIEQLTKYFF